MSPRLIIARLVTSLCLCGAIACVEPPSQQDSFSPDVGTVDMSVDADTYDLDASQSPEDMPEDQAPDLPQVPVDSRPDIAPDADMGEPPTHPVHNETWCERVTIAPPARPDTLAIELARAHASMRFFGAHTSYEEVDEALSEALRTWDDPDRMPDLSIYQARLSEACVLTPAPAPTSLSSTRVELRDGVAFVTPGLQPPSIPEDAEAIVLDWRALPDHPDLDLALRTSLQNVFTEPFIPSSFTVRKHDGLADEVFAVGRSLYTRSLSTIHPEPIEGLASTRKPLAIWTDVRLPPKAAQLAGAARQQGRAALLGEPILAAMAESSYRWIGDRVLVHRTRDMLGENGQRWPDFMGQDAHVWTHEQVLDTWTQRGFDAATVRGLAIRPRIQILTTPTEDTVSPALHPGVMRAGLLTAYGAFDLFFAFFDEVGRGVDTALPELLKRIDPSQASPRRADYHELLERLIHHLHDAHCYINDLNQDATSHRVGQRYLPIRIAYVDQRPVIDWSDEPLLEPGDEILELEGVPVMTWMESWRERISAATPDNALRQMGIYFIFHPEEFVSMRVRRLDGTETLLDVPTQAMLGRDQIDKIVGLRFRRDAGFLDDLGAPGVLYINLDRSKITTRAQVTALYDGLNTADSVILDMRGYPGVWDIFQIAGAIVGTTYSSPLFSNPVYEGTDALTTTHTRDTYPGPPSGVFFSGRALLLVGAGTQSFAENFSMGLVTEGAVEVVGSQSSGTNGNITGLIAPGGFTVTFTGLDVRFSDDTRFHGVGILPQHEVRRDITQIASGEDHVLAEAIDLLVSTP